jgi:acylphosphatase
VGFRAWTAWRARELGLRGWVRNRLDGSVELEAEGPVEVLSRFREELHRGPPAARVLAVHGLDASDDLLAHPFEVRY